MHTARFNLMVMLFSEKLQQKSYEECHQNN